MRGVTQWEDDNSPEARSSAARDGRVPTLSELAGQLQELGVPLHDAFVPRQGVSHGDPKVRLSETVKAARKPPHVSNLTALIYVDPASR